MSTYTTTEYPSATGNGMKFIGGHWVFAGPEGYRVRPIDGTDNQFRVFYYTAAGERPVTFPLAEDDAHRAAATMAQHDR